MNFKQQKNCSKFSLRFLTRLDWRILGVPDTTTHALDQRLPAPAPVFLCLFVCVDVQRNVRQN